MGCGNSKPHSHPRSVEHDTRVQPRRKNSSISNLSSDSDVSNGSSRNRRRPSSKESNKTDEKARGLDEGEDNKQIVGIDQDEKERTTAEERGEHDTDEKVRAHDEQDDNKHMMDINQEENERISPEKGEENNTIEEETRQTNPNESTEIEITETTGNVENEISESEEKEVIEDKEKETTEVESKDVTGNEANETTDVRNESSKEENDVIIEKNEEDSLGEEAHLTLVNEEGENVASNRATPLSAHLDTEKEHDLGKDEGNEPLADDYADDGHDDVYTPFDDEEEENKDDDGYAPNSLGLMIKLVGLDQSNDNEDMKPSVDAGKLYTDKEFPLEIAIVQGNSHIEWKRPKDFMDDPKLFSGGASRYDIGQGSAGTCWFLSTVSVIAENKDMLNQIVPKAAYNIEDPENYNGIFHARFYRFGRWEDIYIDDCLPVIHDGKVLWGAKSSSDENELWVPLLEKAFARLHGSYDAIYGGQPGDAYLQLTGGIGERIDLENQDDNPISFYNRLQNALNTGSQVTCVVPDEYDEHLGLVGGHAYSLVGVAEVNDTKLICVRNPWGRGEWMGPWSDKSAEWSSVPDEIRPMRKDDGEFYVSLEDFLKYFSQTTICSLTPDFDCDGASDLLKYQLSIFGQWTREQSGPFGEVLKNPRFAFTITDEGIMGDGTVPFVMQIVQHTAKRKTDHTSMRCDVFRILTDKLKGNERYAVVEIQGKKNNVYTSELQSTFRHKLKPGRYMVVPSTCDGGVEKAFLLRLFTSAALKNIKDVPINTVMLSSEHENEFSNEGKSYPLTFEKTFLGAFISDVNAGGQVSNRETYSTNPQYLITIPSVGEDVPLVIHVMQKQEETKYPVGFRLFPLEDGVKPPVDINYLYSTYDSSPSNCEGAQSKFMISWDVDVRYVLPPGRYLGLVHLDLPNTETSFAVLFKSNTSVNIKGFQTG